MLSEHFFCKFIADKLGSKHIFNEFFIFLMFDGVWKNYIQRNLMLTNSTAAAIMLKMSYDKISNKKVFTYEKGLMS